MDPGRRLLHEAMEESRNEDSLIKEIFLESAILSNDVMSLRHNLFAHSAMIRYVFLGTLLRVVVFEHPLGLAADADVYTLALALVIAPDGTSQAAAVEIAGLVALAQDAVIKIPDLGLG